MTTGLVEGLRAVKDADEIEALARACAITVAGAGGADRRDARRATPSWPLARRLEQLFGELGAEDRAFDTIVGSGPNSAIPHHQPGRRALAEGDLVVIDCRRARRRLPRGHDAHLRGRARAGPLAGRDPRGRRGRPGRRAADAYRAGAGARELDADRPRPSRRSGPGGPLHARARARRGPRDPRGADGRGALHGYHRGRHGDHRRARGLPPRPRRGSHRRHPRRLRRRPQILTEAPRGLRVVG